MGEVQRHLASCSSVVSLRFVPLYPLTAAPLCRLQGVNQAAALWFHRSFQSRLIFPAPLLPLTSSCHCRCFPKALSRSFCSQSLVASGPFTSDVALLATSLASHPGPDTLLRDRYCGCALFVWGTTSHSPLLCRAKSGHSQGQQ